MEELLKEFLKENKELEALLVVDEEGIVVYKEVKDELPFDPEEVAVELVNPSNRINELVEDSLGEQGGLEEILVFTKRRLFLVFKLVNETFLVAVARRTPLYGRLRFKLRSRLPQIIKSL
jgi:predicted regulator of Ras-like GTPase activity (Roadblock/LC7/MglB family)